MPFFKFEIRISNEIRNSNFKCDDHEEDDDYLDILLQEAIDEVNRRSFGRHVPHEEMVSIDVESENYSSSFKFLVDDAVQPFQTVNKMKKLACPKTTLNVF